LAIPLARKAGKMSAKAVANAVFPTWVDTFGVPTVVTSDRGPAFVGVWWKTLCSLMGVRKVYAQAYHHQANGRAEVQIKEFKSWLSRLTDGGKGNWVDFLPLVRRMYHDIPRLTGHSPYQIVYGRTRLMGGLTYPERTGVEAEEWFATQRELEKCVHDVLKDVQEKRIESVNKRRKEAWTFKRGDRVWMRRVMESKESHLRSPWTGPYVVSDREGSQSYLIDTGMGRTFAVHASQLKPYVEDTVTGRATPLYYYKKTEGQAEEASDTWKLECILGHRREKGELQFLVQWEGGTSQSATWQPARDFFQEYCGLCVKHAREHGLAAEVLQGLPVDGNRGQSEGAVRVLQHMSGEAGLLSPRRRENCEGGRIFAVVCPSLDLLRGGEPCCKYWVSLSMT
jgi:hypothetical protein